MSSNKIFLSVIFAIFLLNQIECRVKVDPITRFIVDEYGRKRVYHGTNWIQKSPPYYPNNLTDYNIYDSLVKEDYENLKSFGLTFLRCIFYFYLFYLYLIFFFFFKFVFKLKLSSN